MPEQTHAHTWIVRPTDRLPIYASQLVCACGTTQVRVAMPPRPASWAKRRF